MFAKPMFINSTPDQYRSVINPVVGESGTNGLNVLTKHDMRVLEQIETDCTYLLACQEYENIYDDYSVYTDLSIQLNSIRSKVKNTKLTLLLKMVNEALLSVFNTKTLYETKLQLIIDKNNLTKEKDDILSGKNNNEIQPTTTMGTLSITKKFKLSPIFNYYVLIYGLPAKGVGFDPNRIAFLEAILKKNGINNLYN